MGAESSSLWDAGAAPEQGRGDPPGSAPPGTVVQGTVERITYRREDTQYTVLKVEPEMGYGDPKGPSSSILPQRLTAVGRAPRVEEGLRVRLTGEWTQHATHGRQFDFELIELLPPHEREGLVRYLSSKTFSGIGETIAGRIVDHLGPDALERIRTAPEVLDDVVGLRPAVRDELVETLRNEEVAHASYSFLLALGLGPWQTQLIVKKLGENCRTKIEADPYLLATKVEGIGFITADRVAQELGYAPGGIERRAAGLLHALRVASGRGHTLLTREQLFAETRELLRTDFEDEALDEALQHSSSFGYVVIDEARSPGEGSRRLVYLPHLHTSETSLCRNLATLLERTDARPLAGPEALAAAADRAGLTLDPQQGAAVLGLLATPVGLLTGGPGVGKTTIVRLVVDLALSAGETVLLASPTGRAAKRLAEATGRKASTIHRLLGYDAFKGGFAHDDAEPLDAGLVIVDEISMLDVVLAHHLLKAIQPPTRLLLVGDPDQLPSVAAGNVLADMIASERVPLWRLSQIYRQSRTSLIIENAHRILAGEEVQLPEKGERDADFYFFPCEGEDPTAARLIEVVTERIPRNFGYDWTESVQVLAPMYRGACGVDALNEGLRERLGIGGHELRFRDQSWRTGDRVIHTRNDYERSIFNGDMGRVLKIEEDGSGLTVRYPEQDVTYEPEQLNDLRPAFCITVHRSQGSEFPVVVMPLVTQHYMMLQRYLLYTAITRAQHLCVLVGSRRALRMAIENAEVNARESHLRERLVATCRDSPL